MAKRLFKRTPVLVVLRGGHVPSRTRAPAFPAAVSRTRPAAPTATSAADRASVAATPKPSPAAGSAKYPAAAGREVRVYAAETRFGRSTVKPIERRRTEGLKEFGERLLHHDQLADGPRAIKCGFVQKVLGTFDLALDIVEFKTGER